MTYHFDHVGISVANLDAQRLFYGEAFGLTQIEEQFENAEMHVRSIILSGSDGFKVELIERQGSTAQAALDPFSATATQGLFHWALYVDDLEATYKGTLAAGATSVSPPGNAVRPGARFAYVHDPEGNLIELIQPATAAQGSV